MIDILLQIDFTNLASPEVFDSSLAFMISIMMSIMMWAGAKLRSPAVFLSWGLTVVVLILTFITALPFLWFWILLLFDALVVSISASVRYLL